MASERQELHYWRARALELEEALLQLRERMLALGRTFQPHQAGLFDGNPAEVESELFAADLFAGWQETAVFRPADVATEMRLVWQRLGPFREP